MQTQTQFKKHERQYAAYIADKSWSDKFLKKVRCILGQIFIVPASLTEDRKENTDLTILKSDSYRFAVRIRRYKYFIAYRNEITIRAYRKSGKKTELAKILDGLGDYFFYGFANQSETDLLAWVLVDIKRMRNILLEYIFSSEISSLLKHNKDNYTSFLPVPLTIISNAIIAKGGELKNEDFREN